MSENFTTDTLVAGENVQPVATETEATTDLVEQNSDDKVTTATPAVEIRDGKMFVDNVRVYTRDDTNKIASNATKEYESRLLNDLSVDSLDQVKKVVTQLQNAGDTEANGLDVESLRSAVARREQTVEELKNELQTVRTEMQLSQHISKLQSSMPSTWNEDQRSAVLDLMKARNMLHLEDGNFYIRNGNDFVTQDGETPDYAGAVTIIGKTLGLPFAKPGVGAFDADRKPSKAESSKVIDEGKLANDPAYRNAYVRLRNQGISREAITDSQIRQTLEKISMGDPNSRMTKGAQTAKTKSRR